MLAGGRPVWGLWLAPLCQGHGAPCQKAKPAPRAFTTWVALLLPAYLTPDLASVGDCNPPVCSNGEGDTAPTAASPFLSDVWRRCGDHTLEGFTDKEGRPFGAVPR
jgi:hypothetical protein